MVTAFQETGVHVGPSCFVNVGKGYPCSDEEEDTMNKAFLLADYSPLAQVRLIICTKGLYLGGSSTSIHLSGETWAATCTMILP